MQFRDHIHLWRTVTGSQMWNMHRPNSDIDYYVGYIADSKSFLLGNTHTGGHQTQTAEYDETRFELGHIVHEVQKGNVNHLWGIISPVVTLTSTTHDQLKTIVLANPVKSIYHSINGMAIHNIKHFLEEKKQGVADNQQLFLKKLRTIIRVLRFGIHALDTGQYEFAASDETDPTISYYLLKELRIAYDNSSLPERADAEPYETFLLSQRMENL